MAGTISDLCENAERLQNNCVSRATGGGNSQEYVILRRTLQNTERSKKLLPRFISTCADDSQFWQFIKYKFPTYAERRQFIWDECRPLIQALECGSRTPTDDIVTGTLPDLNSDHVHEIWQRALERRTDDSDGAITLARTLLESVCKHILDKSGEIYPDDCDLPKLYRRTSELLNLAPSQHTEQVLKQILGGCTAVVEGLGALRNRVSDAHGQGVRTIRAAPRHAELAVNLAGSMAMFLVSTWVAKMNSKPK